MSQIHLNELSKVYRESIAEGYGMGEIDQKVGAVTPIPKDEQDAARKRLLAKAKAKRAQLNKEGLDPVGKEDSDVDNDGDTDSSDKYLLKRRKAIGKAMSKKKGMKESFSDWRTDLSEVMTDSLDEKPIKEKKVNNTIKINPKLGEAVEELGGELIEAEVIEGAGLYANIHAKRRRGGKMRKKGDKGAPTSQDFANAAKTAKEEVEIDEADSLAAMAARREKRLKAQRKKEGTSATGQDFGHDHGISSDERKKRQKAEFDAFVGRGKKKTNEEVEEVDEAMRPGPRQRAMAAKQYQQYKKGGGTYSSRDRATAHNVAVRNDGPGTPSYEKKSTGGKGKRFAGYGDQGAGNKARRRMGEKPMRGDRDPRNEEFTSEDASMSPRETALQKKKLMVDLAIARARKQDLTKKSETPTKAMGEEASDAMKDRRMERGGVAGNVDYSKAPGKPNTFGKKKPDPDAKSKAMKAVKDSITAKYGKGAIFTPKKK